MIRGNLTDSETNVLNSHLDRSRVLRHKTLTRVRIFLGFCKLWCHLTQLQNASVGVRYNKHPIQIETDTHTHTHTRTVVPRGDDDRQGEDLQG
jgi:hypothetical protein